MAMRAMRWSTGSGMISMSLDPRRWASAWLRRLAPGPIGIPTLPQWGLILLSLSFLMMATWQLAGRPALVRVGTTGGGTILPNEQHWLTSLLLGQAIATLSLVLYALLVGPLVPHDGVGAFLAGLLIGTMVESYRRSAGR